jgi:hypothetical protein
MALKWAIFSKMRDGRRREKVALAADEDLEKNRDCRLRCGHPPPFSGPALISLLPSGLVSRRGSEGWISSPVYFYFTIRRSPSQKI